MTFDVKNETIGHLYETSIFRCNFLANRVKLSYPILTFVFQFHMKCCNYTKCTYALPLLFVISEVLVCHKVIITTNVKICLILRKFCEINWTELLSQDILQLHRRLKTASWNKFKRMEPYWIQAELHTHLESRCSNVLILTSWMA
jgi:hypothetical protein